jgi:hypothetical protein
MYCIIKMANSSRWTSKTQFLIPILVKFNFQKGEIEEGQ